MVGWHLAHHIVVAALHFRKGGAGEETIIRAECGLWSCIISVSHVRK